MSSIRLTCSFNSQKWQLTTNKPTNPKLQRLVRPVWGNKWKGSLATQSRFLSHDEELRGRISDKNNAETRLMPTIPFDFIASAGRRKKTSHYQCSNYCRRCQSRANYNSRLEEDPGWAWNIATCQPERITTAGSTIFQILYISPRMGGTAFPTTHSSKVAVDSAG